MKPFLSGRPAVGNVALRSAGDTTDEQHVGVRPVGSLSASHPSNAAHEHGPKVECIKQGDKVVRMIITCTCGERIEVECLYPAAG